MSRVEKMENEADKEEFGQKGTFKNIFPKMNKQEGLE